MKYLNIPEYNWQHHVRNFRQQREYSQVLFILIASQNEDAPTASKWFCLAVGKTAKSYCPKSHQRSAYGGEAIMDCSETTHSLCCLKSEFSSRLLIYSPTVTHIHKQIARSHTAYYTTTHYLCFTLTGLTRIWAAIADTSYNTNCLRFSFFLLF